MNSLNDDKKFSGDLAETADTVLPETGGKNEKNDSEKSEIKILRQALEEGKLKLSDDGNFENGSDMGKEKIRLRGALEKGESKTVFIVTLINGILYTAWFIVYIFCAMLRYFTFSLVRQEILLSNVPLYTVKINSPLFGILKAVILFLPLVVILWTALVVASDLMKKNLPDKRLIIVVMFVDAVCACTVAADIISLHMVFI